MGEPEALWDFATRVYASEKVRTSCLELQDRHGADINLLLWAAWTAQMFGRSITAEETAAARQATEDWQRDVLAPLREVRKRLKDGHPDLYERAQALELQFERIEIERLEAMTATGGPAGSDALAANLRLAAPAGVPDGDLAALAHALLPAVRG